MPRRAGTGAPRLTAPVLSAAPDRAPGSPYCIARIRDLTNGRPPPAPRLRAARRRGAAGLRGRSQPRLLQVLLPRRRKDRHRHHREEDQGGARHLRRPPPPPLPRLLRQWLRRVHPDRPAVEPERGEGSRPKHLGPGLRDHRRDQEGARVQVPQHGLLRRHRGPQRPRRRQAGRRAILRAPHGPPRLARLQPRGSRQQPPRAGHPGPEAHHGLRRQGLHGRGNGGPPGRRPQHRPGPVHLHRARRDAHGARVPRRHQQALRRAQPGHGDGEDGRDHAQRGGRRQLLRPGARQEDAAHHRPAPGAGLQDHAHHQGDVVQARPVRAALRQGHGEAQRAQGDYRERRRDQEDVLRVQQPRGQRQRGVRDPDQLREPGGPRGAVGWRDPRVGWRLAWDAGARARRGERRPGREGRRRGQEAPQGARPPQAPRRRLST